MRNSPRPSRLTQDLVTRQSVSFSNFSQRSSSHMSRGLPLLHDSQAHKTIPIKTVKTLKLSFCTFEFELDVQAPANGEILGSQFFPSSMMIFTISSSAACNMKQPSWSLPAAHKRTESSSNQSTLQCISHGISMTNAPGRTDSGTKSLSYQCSIRSTRTQAPPPQLHSSCQSLAAQTHKEDILVKTGGCAANRPPIAHFHD